MGELAESSETRDSQDWLVVKSGGDGVKERVLIPGDLRPCLSEQEDYQSGDRREEVAEVSRGHSTPGVSGEGPNRSARRQGMTQRGNEAANQATGLRLGRKRVKPSATLGKSLHRRRRPTEWQP